MAEAQYCSDCGSTIEASSLLGLCPRCLAGVALGNPTDGGAQLTAERLAPLFPQLEILEPVGRGGMSVVYKARQPGLDRLVALKILTVDAARDPAFAERFSREARALAQLSHPNIVAVHEFGQSEGLFYLVMEFVEGPTLRQVLDEKKQLPPHEALPLIFQMCDVLEYAHGEGVVHRDIKPENILLDKRGRVKITDFGLAKMLEHRPASRYLTGTGQVVGTLHYMAPEQIERPDQVDQRADIYSVGVVFYEMLTGELPLGHFAPPSRKVQVDKRLDEIILIALEKEPELRYQRASQVKSDLESIPLENQLPEATANSLALERQFNRATATTVALSTLWAVALATVKVTEVLHPEVVRLRSVAETLGINLLLFCVIAGLAWWFYLLDKRHALADRLFERPVYRRILGAFLCLAGLWLAGLSVADWLGSARAFSALALAGAVTLPWRWL